MIIGIGFILLALVMFYCFAISKKRKHHLLATVAFLLGLIDLIWGTLHILGVFL